MSNEKVDEYDAFIQKVKAENNVEAPTITANINHAVLKHLYREVILVITPLIEEMREAQNLFVLYHDSKQNPKGYTDAEREHLLVLYEAMVEAQKENLRKRAPFNE